MTSYSTDFCNLRVNCHFHLAHEWHVTTAIAKCPIQSFTLRERSGLLNSAAIYRGLHFTQTFLLLEVRKQHRNTQKTHTCPENVAKSFYLPCAFYSACATTMLLQKLVFGSCIQSSWEEKMCHILMRIKTTTPNHRDPIQLSSLIWGTLNLI